MTGEITPPIFVLYEGVRLIAFDEVFEAEMTAAEHFERIERVLDGAGRELRFGVKQQYAARLEATATRDEHRLREFLIWTLQELGDIDVEGFGDARDRRTSPGILQVAQGSRCRLEPGRLDSVVRRPPQSALLTLSWLTTPGGARSVRAVPARTHPRA